MPDQPRATAIADGGWPGGPPRLLAELAMTATTDASTSIVGGSSELEVRVVVAVAID